MANQLWCIDFLTSPTPPVIPPRPPATQKLILDSCKMVEKQSEAFCGIFSKFKISFYCIFEIYKLWQSGFSRVYSNCCCSCSFEPEIINIGQSSHKTYSKNILNFQESSPISNTHMKYIVNIYIYIYIYIYRFSIYMGPMWLLITLQIVFR